MKICLDPGHYGDSYNPGVAAGYVESNFTWDYHLLLKTELEKYGVEVSTTRADKDTDLGLKARGLKAEGSDLFISIHSNASSRSSANMVWVMYSVRAGGQDVGRAVGEALTNMFISEWGSIENLVVEGRPGTKDPTKDYYSVLYGCSAVGVPGIIVEHSFHTYAPYCEWAMTPGNIEKMAVIEAKAIADYYHLTKVDEEYAIQLNQNLKKGDKGPEVVRLQKRLCQVSPAVEADVRSHSFKDGQPDGSFGGGLKRTITNLQALAGIATTGELDDDTRAMLNSNIAELYGARHGNSSGILELQASLDAAYTQINTLQSAVDIAQEKFEAIQNILK